MSEEPVLDDNERNAILQYINRPKVDEARDCKSKDVSESKTEYTGLETSAELFEKSMKNRQMMENTEAKEINEAREKVFKIQRFDLIEEMGF